jgi:hypothetical protein
MLYDVVISGLNGDKDEYFNHSSLCRHKIHKYYRTIIIHIVKCKTHLIMSNLIKNHASRSFYMLVLVNVVT